MQSPLAPQKPSPTMTAGPVPPQGMPGRREGAGKEEGTSGSSHPSPPWSLAGSRPRPRGPQGPLPAPLTHSCLLCSPAEQLPQEEIKYALHTLNASLMKTGRAASLNCLAVKSVTSVVLEALAAGAGGGARGGRGRAGWPPARSPLGSQKAPSGVFQRGAGIARCCPDMKLDTPSGGQALGQRGAGARALPAWDSFPHSQGALVSSQSS